MKNFSLILLLPLLLFSCIQDEAPNDEADVLSIVFPDGSLRAKRAEIGNDYIILFPKKGVNLKDSAIVEIELSAGASFRRIDYAAASDTLFFIETTSQSGIYTKRYPVIASRFPVVFDFENWTKPSSNFLFENPKEGSLQWFSSNNGAAIAWNKSSRPADEYPIRKTSQVFSGASAVELRTMVGPGNIMGIIKIPCLAGSLYLGGFEALTGLTNPLRSTRFGVPFNDGKPVALTGYYIYKDGDGDYIFPDGRTDKSKKDTCAIYALLFKTDSRTQFLYGDNIATSPNIIARAEMKPEDVRQSNEFIRFEIPFDYESYPVPFSWKELNNDEYKITIVFSSSHKGDLYEGRIGNTLIIDKLELIYEEEY